MSDSDSLSLPDPAAWTNWLAANHDQSPGVWLRLAKKGCTSISLFYAEALEAALCHGWIDGQKRPENDRTWLQRFTPRGKKSIWSKINREKALALIEGGRMHPAGLREVERAKADGRWDAAYEGQRTATVPADLQAALDQNPRARDFFATLRGANRYAVLFRIQNAKKPETRARKIAQFVTMLENHQTFHSPNSTLPE
jgi:uncharacterized protein YdeI (YjbR/CyaY-like superfamily)